MITEVLDGVGSWSIKLRADTPQTVLDLFADPYFAHLIITPTRIGTEVDVLALSRYTGVITRRKFADERELGGPGLLSWLGDGDGERGGKGANFETSVVLSSDTFVDAVREVLPDSIAEGTLNAQPSTTTQTIQAWGTPRDALDSICSAFGCEYQVTPQGALNAGTEAELYPTATNPTTVILPKRRGEGEDPLVKSLPLADATLDSDRDDYTTRVIILPSGDGVAIQPAVANLESTTYKDLHGNTIVKKRVISASTTDVGLAPTLALAHLGRFAVQRHQLSLSTEEFDVFGTVALGETVWVQDEESSLVDLDNELRFRGEVLHPVKLRVHGLTWPVTKEMGKFVRDKDGLITDISDWVQPESGASQIDVGAFSRSLVNDPNEQAGPRLTADQSVPAIPVFGAITSQVFTDDNGIERCRVVVPWSTPANTDATVIVDGAFYELGYKLAGAGSYDYRVIPWGINSNEFTEFPVGSNLDFIIQASDSANPPNRSGFSAPTNFIAAADTTPPGTPAASTNAGNPLEIQVTHGLTLAAGGNLPDDLHHLNIYIGTSAGFTPGPGNFAGPIMASKANLDLGIPVVGTFGIYDAAQRWVKVTAVDASGNQSTPSAASTVTAQLLSTGHYGLLTVTDAIIGSMSVSKLTAGDISAALITLTGAGKFRFGRTSAPFHHGYIDASGIHTFRNGSAAYTGGTSALKHDIATDTLSMVGGTIIGTDIVSDLFRTAIAGTGNQIAIGTNLINPAFTTLGFYFGGDGEAPADIYALTIGSGPTLRPAAAFSSGRMEVSGVLQPASTVASILLSGRNLDATANTERIALGFGGGVANGIEIFPGRSDFYGDLNVRDNDVFGDQQIWLYCASSDIGLLLGTDGKCHVYNNVLTNHHDIVANAFTVVPSDRRQKQNVSESVGNLEIVRAAAVYNYEEIKRPGRQRLGLIAQELPEEDRRVVRVRKSADSEEEEDVLSYDLNVELARVWGAVRELATEHDEIKDKVAALSAPR